MPPTGHGPRLRLPHLVLAPIKSSSAELASRDCVGDVAHTVYALDRYNRPCGDGTLSNPPRRRMRRRRLRR